jgi:hypothetical protein
LSEVYDKKINARPFPYHLDCVSKWYPCWYGKGHVLTSIYISPNLYIYITYWLSNLLMHTLRQFVIFITYNTAIECVKWKKNGDRGQSLCTLCIQVQYMLNQWDKPRKKTITPHARYRWCCFQIKDVILCIQKLNLNFPAEDTTHRTTVQNCCLQLK